MEASWAKHFERSEFLGSIVESSNHIRISDQWGLAPVSAETGTEADASLLVPHQGLAINAWADQVGAAVFASAVNRYAREHWATARQSPVIVVSPHNSVWSAEEIRRRAGEGGFGAIALPFGPVLFGSTHYDPVYEAASEVGLPIVAHYSGVEGRYSGAAPLSGGVHYSSFSRKILMPQVASRISPALPSRAPSSGSRGCVSYFRVSASRGCPTCCGASTANGAPSVTTCRG